MDEHYAFGGGASATQLHPLVAVWMLIAIVLILTLPRQKAIIPFLLAFFTIPLAQVIVVGGLHFPVVRVLILVGLIRMVVRGKAASGDKFPGGFNSIDGTAFVDGIADCWPTPEIKAVCRTGASQI